MKHLEFERSGLKVCLTGCILTVYNESGCVMFRSLFPDTKSAQQAIIDLF